MCLKTDTAGPVINTNVKLSNYGVTWNTRFEQIYRDPGEVIICTFSLSNLSFVSRTLSRRSHNVTIIAHDSYRKQAQMVKNWYPDVDIYVSPYSHAKMLLAEPATVYVSSENLGHKKKSFDASICMESEEIYQHYRAQVERLINNPETERIEAKCETSR